MEIAQQNRQAQINRILNKLDQREQEIIIRRFGLGESLEPSTLKEVGEAMGVTKERIRQIESRALDKLRLAAKRNISTPRVISTAPITDIIGYFECDGSSETFPSYCFLCTVAPIERRSGPAHSSVVG